jgi:hypothetical protein
LYILSAPALEELGLAVMRVSTKHGAVFPRLASCFFDPAVDFLPVSLLGLDDMKVIFASRYVDVGIAGILLLCALNVVRHQRASKAGLVLVNRKIACCAILLLSCGQ